MNAKLVTLANVIENRLFHNRFSKKTLKSTIQEIMEHYGIKEWSIAYDVEQNSADYNAVLVIDDDTEYYSYTDIYYCKMNAKGAKALGCDETMFITEISTNAG
jgi:hypothetical protein